MCERGLFSCWIAIRLFCAGVEKYRSACYFDQVRPLNALGEERATCMGLQYSLGQELFCLLGLSVCIGEAYEDRGPNAGELYF